MASVLKAEDAKRQLAAATPVAFNIEDIQQRARKYLQETQQQAEEILRQARIEAERIREQARQAALQDAAQAIQDQAEQRAQQLSDARCKTAIAACQQTVRELTQHSTHWMEMWRNRTVEIACKIADKIVRQAMAHDREILRGWMEEALVAIRGARHIRILVHPDDFSVAGRFLQQLAKDVPHANGAEVVPDPEVEPGGCSVRSENGSIDQQLETQLRRLAEQLGAAWTFLLTWGSVPCIYYGDEIGMRFLPDLPDVEGSICDPGYNRAGCRTPMQWDHGLNAGFSTADPSAVYLPVDPADDRPTVADQLDDPSSTLHLVQRLVQLRRETPALRTHATQEVVHDGYPFAYVRDDTHLIVVNPSGVATSLTYPGLTGASILFGNGVDVDSEELAIAGFGYAVLELVTPG